MTGNLLSTGSESFQFSSAMLSVAIALLPLGSLLQREDRQSSQEKELCPRSNATSVDSGATDSVRSKFGREVKDGGCGRAIEGAVDEEEGPIGCASGQNAQD